MAVDAASFRVDVKPTWCPGCGDYAVLQGLQAACAASGAAPHDVVVVSGIGCSSILPRFMGGYGFHTLHGRALAAAQGVKLANPRLTVVAVSGDGDAYGIGVGHLVHAMRRNMDITCVVMNNQVYGLTTGHASPTTARGGLSKSTPQGALENALNPLALALVSGATFVGRGFSGDAAGLRDLVARAVAHKGFALVDVLSPCVTYNKLNTYAWFRERVYHLEDKGHDPSDLEAALTVALASDDRIGLGALYQAKRPVYEDEEVVLRTFGPLTRPVERKKAAWAALVEEFL